MLRTCLALALLCLVFSGCKTSKNEVSPKAATPKKEQSASESKSEQPMPDKPAPALPKAVAEPKAEKSAADANSMPASVQVKDVGLETPESIFHDTARDLYLVSNINGDPLAVDGNGFISQVTPDGKVKDLKWIDGAAENVTLNAPKGMTVAAEVLYVTDLDHIRMFDAANGVTKGALKIEGATFLNDLCTSDDGTVYVSDSGYSQGFKPSGTDAIYMLKDGKAVPVVRSSALGNPNGLSHRDGKLWVVTFGSGDVYSLELTGKKVAQPKPSYGQLDGLSFTNNGQLVFSSWEAKAIYMGSIGGPFEAIVTGVEAPADIAIDKKRNRVLIPLFTRNELRFRSL